MLEIMSPAGSPEGVIAAVQNGADAVYLGFGAFNARAGAKNFTKEEFAQAAEYCRVRGVKTYLTLNTLVSDREFASAVDLARSASRLGADAIIVQDLGLMRAIRQAVPKVPVHSSTQMGIHNLEGVKMAAAMGASRVVLARELSKREIEYICKRSPIEVEVFVHGALCMCYSGQCYMSAVIGRRSGNRGLCAQPCRLNYSSGGHMGEYLLSLKDNCLVEYLQELEDIGVTAIKIEGRMRRPEYSAIVTGIYSKAVHSKRAPSNDDIRALQTAFSRQGFTDGYYNESTGPGMFGIRTDDDERTRSVMFQTARKNYLNGEYQRVPVRFAGIVREGEPAKLAAMDDNGNTASVAGPVPQLAFHREITAASLQTQLHKTGGTPFFCVGVKSQIDPGLSLPVSAFNEMRRELLSELMEKRKALEPREEGEFASGYQLLNSDEPPCLNVSVLKLAQLSPEMAELAPRVLYIPASEFMTEGRELEPFMRREDITLAVIMPRVVHDNERKKLTALLSRARDMGFTDALVSNLGQIQFARGMGFDIRGDFGLNIYNSHTLRVFKDLGLQSATLSFEMRLAEIRDVSKSINTEIITYGRLPLMVTENCIIKSSMGACACDNFSGLKDRQGASFPVVREFECRNVLLNSKKLFLADKRGETSSIGLWGERLMFTTENANECIAVMKRYMGHGDYLPGGHTRGLYFRGVE